MNDLKGFFHQPVLLAETLQAINLKEGGVYADGTVGGGGHSEAILEHLHGNCTLYAIDRDEDALHATRERLSAWDRVHLIHGNFHHIRDLLPDVRLDGALLDLGVSSWQLDQAPRGFSYHEDAPLDMRMDRSEGITAAEWLNHTLEKEIAQALYDYADERWGARIAKTIVQMRAEKPFTTTFDLVRAVDRAIPKAVRRKEEGHPARRAFQAVRIAVNDEIVPLEKALESWVHMLVPGGRLCVITFHSIEDRIVKHTFRRLKNPCVCLVNAPICTCGKKPVVVLSKGYPRTPEEAELIKNPRARSARLRVLEKLPDA